MRATIMMVLTACSSSGAPQPVKLDYADQNGRQCSVTSVLGEGPATCDVPPQPTTLCQKTYPAPCWYVFAVSEDGGALQLENCASCCEIDGGAAETTPSDCSFVVCQTADDCPKSFMCPSGVCVLQ